MIIYAFIWFIIISIIWTTEHSWVIYRLLKSLLFYHDVNMFSILHIIFPDSFFCDHSVKETVIPSIHKKCITNDCWVSSDLLFVVSYVLGVMLGSGERRMTGQVVMDRTDTWCYDSTGISASAFFTCSCWFFYCASRD